MCYLFFEVWLLLCPDSLTLDLSDEAARDCKPGGMTTLASAVAPWSDELCHLTLYNIISKWLHVRMTWELLMCSSLDLT